MPEKAPIFEVLRLVKKIEQDIKVIRTDLDSVKQYIILQRKKEREAEQARLEAESKGWFY